jgi:hypothetical protein
MKDEGGGIHTALWSALTCQRFVRSPLVATTGQLNQSKEFGVKPPRSKAVTSHRTPKRCFLLVLILLLAVACTTNRGSQTLPAEVESTINTLSDEIAAGRYEKVYNEASELWRQDVTLENSIATFKTLRSKLGTVESRMLLSATEQQNSGGPLKGRAYSVTYRTKFQNAEGMETFTLVERDGRWLLARYLVNSTALR